MADVMSDEDESQRPEDLAFQYKLHNPKPDYNRSMLEIPAEARKRMHDRLGFLYGDTEAERRMV